MVLTKEDTSISDEQLELVSIEYNIHYISCVVTLIYLLYTRVDLCFTVHKLKKVFIKY